MDKLDVARLWSRIETRKVDQCWPWRWDRSDEGYAEYRRLDDIRVPVHRVVYRWYYDANIPAHMVIRHRCDNPCCCNPLHLELGTHADNVQDRVDRDRSAKGEENGRAKLTENQVRVMRRSPLSDDYFADRFNVHPDTVRAARDGDTWKHL